MDEEENPKATGKWSKPEVPHRGWTCLDVEDLGDDTETCQMCERQEIRFVHIMEHPDHPNLLRCGCVCSGNMEQDLVGAKRRDQQARRRSKRPQKADLDEAMPPISWLTSRNGNPWCKLAGGIRCTIYESKHGGYSYVISGRDDKAHRARTRYETISDAKEAAAKILKAACE